MNGFASNFINKSMYNFLKLLRVKQWVKNLFVFSALFFSLHLFNFGLLIKTILAFFCWCLVSSGIYTINDIADRKNDLHHPLKKNRPIAAGKIKVQLALVVSLILLASGMVLSFSLKGDFFFYILLYVLISIVYSFYLKNIFILDVVLISFGFVLRVISGAVVIDVGFSGWMVMCAMLLALFLGFGKRKHELFELKDYASSHRQALDKYNGVFLKYIPYILIAMGIVCYILYTISPETIAKFGTKNLIYTTPFVVYGLFRYLTIVYICNGQGDPTLILLKDKPLLINILFWIITCGLIIYYIK